MKNSLYDFIYDAFKDPSLEGLSSDEFCEAIYERYHLHNKAFGRFTPFILQKDVRLEIMDEILKVYRMKTYGCFSLKAYKEKKN